MYKEPSFKLFKKIDKSVSCHITLYLLQFSLPKQEMEHDDIYEYTWEPRENEWLPYIKKNVLSTAFCYARYLMSMEEINDFGMKTSLTLPSLASKFSNSLRDENDEPIHTYNDPFFPNFVGEALKGADVMFLTNIINLKLMIRFLIIFPKMDVNCNRCNLLERYFEFLNKYEKLYMQKNLIQNMRNKEIVIKTKKLLN